MKIQDIPISTQELSWNKVTQIQSIPDMLARNLLFPESSIPENQRSLKDAEVAILHSRLVRLKYALDHDKPSLCRRILNLILLRFITLWRMRRSLPNIIAHIEGVKKAIWRHKHLMSVEKAKTEQISTQPVIILPVPESSLPQKIIVKEIQYRTDPIEMKRFYDKIKEFTVTLENLTRSISPSPVIPPPTPPRRKSPPQTLQSAVAIAQLQREPTPLEDIGETGSFDIVTPLNGSPKKGDTA